jgi:hypothetical protein
VARTLYVSLTAGNVRDQSGELQPTYAGRSRFNTAAYGAHSCKLGIGEADILICGGKRDIEEESEAMVIYQKRFFISPGLKDDEESGRVRTFVLAEGKYTAADMKALAKWMEKQTEKYDAIHIYSHPDHGELAEKTLLACGVTIPVHLEDSGESKPYSRLVLAYLRFLARFDPLWIGPLSKPLRQMADTRGLNQ